MGIRIFNSRTNALDTDTLRPQHSSYTTTVKIMGRTWTNNEFEETPTSIRSMAFILSYIITGTAKGHENSNDRKLTIKSTTFSSQAINFNAAQKKEQ